MNCEMKSYICYKNMKMNKSVLFLWLGISLLFTSCIATNDLIYLQKKNGDQVASPILTLASKPYRLQTNDVLSITIKANDPKLVTICNFQFKKGNETCSPTLYCLTNSPLATAV